MMAQNLGCMEFWNIVEGTLPGRLMSHRGKGRRPCLFCENSDLHATTVGPEHVTADIFLYVLLYTALLNVLIINL